MKTNVLLCALVAGSVLSIPSQAAVFGSLTFTNPTGTVSSTDVIEVWATLTIDPLSDPYTYIEGEYLGGVNTNDLPVSAYSYDLNEEVAFDSYEYVSGFHGRTCTGNFTVSCSSPGSQYTFSSSAPDPRNPLSFEGTINPGESVDFFLYNLTPTEGAAAVGEYTLHTVSMGLSVYGFFYDGEGHEVQLDTDIYHFSTNCLEANCTFTRTVVSEVPLPAAAWLFGTAILGLGSLKRTKTSAQHKPA